MKQSIVEWSSKHDYDGPDELKYKLNQMVDDGYTIIQVIPTVYEEGGPLRITKALLIVKEPIGIEQIFGGRMY